MGKYIFRRVLIAIPIMFVVVTLVFFMFRIVPGDPAQMMLGEDASQEQVERMRRELGLDRPVPIQYADYIGDLARANLGTSYLSNRPVTTEIGGRFVNTFQLAVTAIVLATVCGLVFGVVSAVTRGSIWDFIATMISLLGISIPVFWLGLLLMYLFSIQLGILPTAGKQGWQYFIMPTITLSVFSLAFITRIARSSMLETLNEDYVRTARAKGVQETHVLIRHALRNALLPIVTVVGLRFGYMVGGAVITETVFAWPGLGRLLVTSVGARDLPVVQAILLVFAGSFVVINLLVDIAYAYIDPRIRYE